MPAQEGQKRVSDLLALGITGGCEPQGQRELNLWSSARASSFYCCASSLHSAVCILTNLQGNSDKS